MGARTFRTVAEGSNAHEAFIAARTQAAHEHGHGGYTGTIAEKRGFVRMSKDALTLDGAHDLADRAIDEGNPLIDDKSGPAGFVQLTDGRFYFFGWASS